MIWKTELESRSPEEVLAGQLARDVAHVCGRTRMDGERLEELTRGVATFCFHHLGGPAFDSDSLSAFMCRALWCAGEKRAAIRWMHEQADVASFRKTALELCRHGGTSAVLLNAAARGAVKYSTRLSSGGARVWILDVGRLHGEDAHLELFFQTALRDLLKHLAPVWSETRGEGYLGLSGCAGLARRVMKGRRSRREIQAWTDDMRGFCSRVLEKAGRHEGWNRVPGVLQLDL